ncbi:hypothetical protein U9M48_001465 [Paspalum notatum var. saurae]|uniref:Uncharacterized protein n=1 Tax=Paspalum notatum var. saurae TaxID=547442 RepID=A0AAQ3PM32_PASNO
MADELIIFYDTSKRNAHTGKLIIIPRGAFSLFKCLRTLDFSECFGILLPASIGQLKQLRCLIAP